MRAVKLSLMGATFFKAYELLIRLLPVALRMEEAADQYMLKHIVPVGKTQAHCCFTG